MPRAADFLRDLANGVDADLHTFLCRVYGGDDVRLTRGAFGLIAFAFRNGWIRPNGPHTKELWLRVAEVALYRLTDRDDENTLKRTLRALGALEAMREAGQEPAQAWGIERN